MWKNYLLVTLRSIKRQKLFAFLNVFGLAIGLAASLLILFWVLDEVSVNRYHADLNRIYQVYEFQTYDTESYPTWSTPGPLADALRSEFPEVEASTHFGPIFSNVTFKYGDKLFDEENGFFADSYVDDVLTLNVIQGSLDDLDEPNGLVINRSLAEKYFGSAWESQQVVGEQIMLDNQWEFRLLGVYEDVPSRSTHRMSFMISYQSIPAVWSWPGDGYMQWGNNYTRTYVKLKEDASVADFAAKIKPLEDIKEEQESNIEFFIQPMSRIHLYDLDGGGRIVYVRIFTIASLFILLIACINFMNLSTALAGQRSKEVGIRKSIGAFKTQLVGQFLTESVFLSLLAMMLGLVFIGLLLPSFNDLVEKQISLFSMPWQAYASLIGITLITGLLAGSYPAFYISSFPPFEVLKGIVKTRGGQMRKGLVIFQFALSVFMIICSLIAYRQLNFIMDYNLGYQKENAIYVSIRDNFNQYYPLLKNEMMNDPNVLGMTSISNLPVDVGRSTSSVSWNTRDPNANYNIYQMSTDYDFVHTMGMELVAGRDFSKERPADTANYLINESLAELMGYDNPVGQEIEMWGNKGEVIGVIKNFNFQRVTSEIEPMIVWNASDNEVFMMRVSGGDLQGTISHLEKSWNSIVSDLPFNYAFMDEEFDQLYKRETTISQLFVWFAVLAILVSCLGLFGLSVFMAEHYKKEIGVRKSLGASVEGLVWHFSQKYLLWVIWANILAAIPAYFLLREWLQEYVYKTNLGAEVFLLALLSSLVLAGITIAYQSVKSARMNPVDALMYE